MPRIRKKTSNRTSTNDKAKLRHKISEGRKKKHKLSKKNTQWKSRLPKDPGIPSNLPFKDQVLAEIADERRRTEAEKQARKTKKQLPLDSEFSEPAHENGEEPDLGDEADSNGVGKSSVDLSALLTTTTLNAVKKKGDSIAVTADGYDETLEAEEPLLVDPSIPDLRSALDKSDVWLYVLDARDPQAHRSTFIESLATKKQKRLVFLLNKIDLVPKESVTAWLSFLRQFHPTFPFRVASSHIPPPDGSTKGKAKLSENNGVGSMALVSHLANELSNGSNVTVALVGFPNSGKSSVINSICGASRLPIYKPDAVKAPTTTTYPQPVSFSTTLPSGAPATIRLIDTPGMESARDVVTSEDSSAISDTLLRARGRIEKMKRPELAARQIISRADPEDLILHYNTPAYNTSEPDAFLSGHARITGRLKKGGMLDILDSARSILRDWRVGKFPCYTLPPKSTGPTPDPTSSEDVVLVDYEATDHAVAPALRSRKDLRTAGGLIRLSPGSIDERIMQLDGPPLRTAATLDATDLGDPSAVGESDEEGNEEDDVNEGSDENEGSEEEQEDGEDDELPQQLAVKRKRAPEPSISTPKRKRTILDTVPPQSQPSAPARKVSFAATGKGRKRINADAASKAAQKRAGIAKGASAGKPAGPKAKLSKPAGKHTLELDAKRASNAKSSDGASGEAYDFKQFF